MKKISLCLIVLVFTVIVCGSVGCESNSMHFDNSLPMKKATVSVDYSDESTNKVQYKVSNGTDDFEIDGAELYNKKNGKKVKKLVGGDCLEIYYTDENYKEVDHVLVEKANVLVLELYSAFTPGGSLTTKDVYSEDPSIAINCYQYEAYWAIDKSGNFIAMKEIADETKLYGTFIEEETEITVENPYKVKLHYIHALYLYDPRVN